MSDTPRTERVAQMCSTDSEHSDVSAYNIMYSHARDLERENARLREALEDAATRMERARNILTDGNPRRECNWGMLATENARAALGGK